MKVKDILENKKRRGTIIRVDCADALAEAVRVMVEHDTGGVAVFDGERFIGMMTFREALGAIRQHGFAEAAGLPCCDLVEKDGHCATPEDTADQVRNIMTSSHIRYLPVVNDGRVTDVISFYDVARSTAKAVDFENRMLKEYIGNWPGDSR